MADAVSKLYAEIGFKINQDGIKQAKAVLEELAKQFDSLNKSAQQASEKYGVFSKKKEQANRRQISEQLKQNREQEKLYKEITDIEEKEYKERLKKEEIFEKERDKRRKQAYNNMKAFAKASWNLAQLAFSGATKMIGESIGRSSELSKLQLFTGISNQDYRAFAERAFATNSGMTQEDVMRDIQNVSSNLQKIALGQGSLSGYKLSGVVASARYGDIAGVIKNFENAIRYSGIAPNMALEVGQQIGLSRDWIYSMFENRRGGKSTIDVSQEQRDEIVETGKAFRQVTFEIQNFKDYITATLSPALQSGADIFRNALASIAKHFENNSEFYSKKIKSIADELNTFAENLKPEQINKFITELKEAMQGFVGFGKFLYKVFKPAPDTSDEKEAWNYIMNDENSSWGYGKTPNQESKGISFSQENEINVTVESKSNNPYATGTAIGRAIDDYINGSTKEKVDFANYSTIMAGNIKG